MNLAEKIKLLRHLEGTLRGMKGPLSKSEMVRLIREELGESISQAYISQLETGKRKHMTATSRELLARFFKVHPGYLVSDPEGYRTELTSISEETRIDDLLCAAAASFDGRDPDLAHSLRTLADHEGTRHLVIIMAKIVREPSVLRMLRDSLEKFSPAVSAGEIGEEKEIFR